MGKIKITIPAQTVQVPAQDILVDVPGAGSSDPQTTPPAPSTPPPPPPALERIFSPTAFWNTKIGARSPAANSQALVAELVAQLAGNPGWFNYKEWSTPFYVVTGGPTVKVSVPGKEATKLHQELQKGVPVPANAAPGAGADGHCTIYDKATDTLYEFWQFRKDGAGNWTCSWGGILKNASASNGVMPKVKNNQGGDEVWGATASSLPVIGGTIMVSEVRNGRIPHALALNIIRPAKGKFVAPALRTDGWFDGQNAIPMGQRFCWPQDIPIPLDATPLAKMIIEAGRDYGMVVRDTAGAVVFNGEDPGQYGADPFAQSFGGKPLWEVMRQIPWDRLIAI